MSIEINPSEGLEIVLEKDSKINIVKDPAAAPGGAFALLKITLGGSEVASVPINQLESNKIAALILNFNNAMVQDLRATS